MTLTAYYDACIHLMHPLHAAQIANALGDTVDQLITDAYTGEIDDLNDTTPESFARWIDSTYRYLFQ